MEYRDPGIPHPSSEILLPLSLHLHLYYSINSNSRNLMGDIPVVRHISSSCVVTFFSPSYKRTVSGFIFSRPLSLDPSIAIEKACFCSSSIREVLKCGAKEPLIMHVVLVLPQAYFLAISLSGKTSLKRLPSDLQLPQVDCVQLSN